MNAIDKRRDSEMIQSNQIRLNQAAIAILIERIASLDQEARDDLMAVFMDLKNCTCAEDVREVEQTIFELMYPAMTGELVTGSAGNPRESEEPGRWNTALGTRIKEIRKAKELTQEDLASRSGLLQSHISRIENGKHSPSNKTLTALAGALGIPIRDLDPSMDRRRYLKRLHAPRLRLAARRGET